MKKITQIADILLQEPLFRHLRKQDLARLVPFCRLTTCTKGETLCAYDTPAENAWLVVDGEFDMRPGAKPGWKVDRCLIGEESILKIDNYAATAMAARDSQVLELPVNAWISFIDDYPGFKEDVIRLFAGRRTGRQAAGREVLPAAEKPAGSSLKDTIGWILATLVPVALLYLLQFDQTLPNIHARYFLAITGSIVIMWIFQLVADFIPALFGLLAMIVFGLAPPATVLSGFSSDSFFMAMSVLGLGTVISASGLGYRVLLHLLNARPTSRWWHNMCVFLVGLFLTPIIPTANGRIAIISPFVKELLANVDRRDYLREAGRLSVSALTGVSLLSAVFLSSKSINFIMYGALPVQVQDRFQWVSWLFAASVCGLALLVFHLVASAFVFRSTSRACLSRHTIGQQLTVIGPLSRPEWVALIGIGVFAASIATSAIHRIDVPWIALSILFGLLMFGFLDKKDFKKNIDWAFLFFLGGLIGFVKTMNFIGVDKWLTTKLTWLNIYMADNFHVFLLMLALAILAVRLILPINATVIIFLTLLLPNAVHTGVNPWLVGFLVLFLAESYFLPYQASYYMQYCSLTNTGSPADDKRIVPYNFGLFAMKLAAIYLSLPFWRALGLL